MELHQQFYVARKAKKVIESCTSTEQLEGARKYINLFFSTFTTPAYSPFSFTGTVKADQSTVKLYNNLMQIWIEKNNELIVN
jgi:hypothetical protein